MVKPFFQHPPFPHVSAQIRKKYRVARKKFKKQHSYQLQLQEIVFTYRTSNSATSGS